MTGSRLEVTRTGWDRGSNPSFGEMLFECVDDHNNDVPDWRMWAVSGDTDDDNSLVTIGFGRCMEELVCG